jgi:hypothetical protein
VNQSTLCRLMQNLRRYQRSSWNLPKWICILKKRLRKKTKRHKFCSFLTLLMKIHCEIKRQKLYIIYKVPFVWHFLACVKNLNNHHTRQVIKNIFFGYLEAHTKIPKNNLAKRKIWNSSLMFSARNRNNTYGESSRTCKTTQRVFSRLILYYCI